LRLARVEADFGVDMGGERVVPGQPFGGRPRGFSRHAFGLIDRGELG
jgi:hypothetical protein